MFNKVLLVMSLTDKTDRMLDALYSICSNPATEVWLLHVMEDAAQADPDGAYYKRVKHRLEDYANAIRNAGYDHVQTLLHRHLHVANDVQDTVDGLDIDFVIMGSHDRGFLEGAFRGSNVFHAVRNVDVPTLVVKGDYDCKDFLRRVLLPTDFSRASLNALKILRNLREQVGDVIFVHVIEDPRDRDIREDREVAEDMLEELRTEMQDFGIRARYEIVRGHAASHEVCRIAEEEDCSLIFTGETGLSPVRGMLRRSTVQNIVLHATRALWIIPDEDSDD